MITIANIEDPVLIDKAIYQIQSVLTQKLSWLQNAFGKAYKIVKDINGVEYFEPAVYLNAKEYFSVLPNDEIGNFSFFTVDDPQEFDGTQRNAKGMLKTKMSITFWLSLTTIYSDDSVIMSEQIKLDILKALTSPGLLTEGRLTVININERAENIYKGYSLKQVDTQFLMFPYCGFKFNCELIINERC